MIRINSRLRVGGACAAILLGFTMFLSPAKADQLIWTENNDDGSKVELYKSKDNSIWGIIYHKDGSWTIWNAGEANPYNDATGRGSHSDRPDVIGMIKSGKATYTVHIAPADSAKLMGVIKGGTQSGGGLGPHYNPGDDDNGHGPGAPPDHSKDGQKTPAALKAEQRALNQAARALATLGSAMGSGDEGGTEGPIGFNKGHGGGNNNNGKKGGDDDGSNSKGKNTNIGKTERDLLGRKPEYVNPPHWDRTKTSVKSAKAGKGDAGKGGDTGPKVLTGNGLLDGGGNGGFGPTGPSAIGAAGGGAGRGAAGIR